MDHLAVKLRPVASSFATIDHKAVKLKGTFWTTLAISRLPNGPNLALVLSLFDGEASPKELPKSQPYTLPTWTILGPSSALWPSHLQLSITKQRSLRAPVGRLWLFSASKWTNSRLPNGLNLALVLSLFNGEASPTELPQTSAWKAQIRAHATLSAIRTY